jgi:hypothetical protein
MGAVYCDGADHDVLEIHQTEPALPPNSRVARVLAQWSQQRLFWSAMGHNLPRWGAAALFADQPPKTA